MRELNQSLAVPIPEKLIEDFCQRWQIEKFYLSGSVLRNDFNKQSNIGVMVQSFPILVGVGNCNHERRIGTNIWA